jgi:hypothetical protein
VRLTGPLPLGTLLAIGALALCGGAGARPSSRSHARAATSSHLQVTQIEYRLILSRGVVRAGPVSLQAIDAGMDPHDLRLRQIGAKREIDTPELTHGQRWERVVYLKPGYYRLWCSVPTHAKLGMRSTLRVVR